MRKSLAVFLVAAIAAISSIPASADIQISTPSGLMVGSTFRTVFVTDARTAAISSDINYYNSFVNNDAKAEAGGGSVTYIGSPVTSRLSVPRRR